MEHLTKVIEMLKRVEENKERYLEVASYQSDPTNVGCIFSSNEDGTYSPLCENGINVPSAVVSRWLESCEECPFCGLTSGTIS